jgi:hypothetical protein
LAWLADGRARRPIQRTLVAACTVGAAALSSMFVFDLVGDRHHFSWWGYLFVADLLALGALGIALRVERAANTPPSPTPVAAE